MGDNPERPLRRVYATLEAAYGFQGWWPLISRCGHTGFDGEGYRLAHNRHSSLSASERFEIAVGAILTQNTSWQNVRRALEVLRRRELLSPDALLAVPSEELAAAVRSSGYYNEKAKKLRLASEFFLEGGYLAGARPPTRQRLLELWGVGDETADSILLYAFGVATFVVDAYTRRLLGRLGLADARTPYASIQRLFESEVPREAELYGEYHALIVEHGKRHCRKRPLCDGCPLRRGCRFGKDYSPES